MYERILLAYDGSLEGRTALREGAVFARQCSAEVFLLSVLDDTNTLLFSHLEPLPRWKLTSWRY